MEKYISIQEAADMMGCHIDTLRTWEEKKLIIPMRTKGGHRRYKLSDIEKMMDIYKEPTLSIEDRLILINQYNILSLLDTSSKEDNDIIIEALDNGYEPHYPFSSLREKPMDDEECSEIRKILEMYCDFQITYRDMKDKNGLSEKDVAFPGFDGNIEGRALGYTHFLIEKLNRFDGLKTLNGDFVFNDFNSHWPLLDKYKIMLKEWEKIKTSKPYREEIKKEEILKILNYFGHKIKGI